MDDCNKNEGGMCRDMKEANQVFKGKLQMIVELIDKENLPGCYITSRNLTMFSTILEYDDGILISELFEGVFSQIGPLFETYEIDEKERKQLMSEIKTQVIQIIKYYNDADKKQLYLALQQLRAIATKFQINRWETGKRKPRTRESE
jgi:hypothetical protein